MSGSLVALRSALMFPADGPPQPGLLTLRDGRVTAIGRNESGAPARDLGDVALLPGLVNAHTHWEFSLLEQPLGEAGMPLPNWIRQVVAQRADDQAGQSRRAEAIRAGCRESLEHGVAAVGDIVTAPWNSDWSGERSGDGDVAFRELLSLDESRVGELIQAASDHLNSASPWQAGVSPHAPYSTHPSLVEAAVELSRQQRAPLAMHVAESPEELELLATGGGPFRQLLDDFGVWPHGGLPASRRPLDTLQVMARAHRSLVIHGNYLQPDEQRLLAENRERMTLVYCPRTHAYFGHEPYPLAQLLAAGVRIALGTDSRALNPDLSVWSEFQFAAKRHADVPPETLLKAITVDAGDALGVAAGRLEVGAQALTTVPLGDGSDPYQRLVTGGDARPVEQSK